MVVWPCLEVNPTGRTLLYFHTSLAHESGAIIMGNGHIAPEHVLGGNHKIPSELNRSNVD